MFSSLVYLVCSSASCLSVQLYVLGPNVFQRVCGLLAETFVILIVLVRSAICYVAGLLAELSVTAVGVAENTVHSPTSQSPAARLYVPAKRSR